MTKRITISDIASKVGVAKSTVSLVLNARGSNIPISEETRERVMRVVRECGYQPNAAARALSTKHTGHIGFILSDDMADGLANVFFALCMAGAEAECRSRGYSLNVSLYNLSILDSFIFPAHISQCSVDGVILAGYVEAGVVQKFHNFGIPCVCIGDYMEVRELVPTVANDVVYGTITAVEHALAMGHRQIGLHYPTRRRDLENADAILKRLAPKDYQVRILHTPDNLGDYSAAKPLLQEWFALPQEERPTVMVVGDQTAIALLKEVSKAGLRCPEDLSVISTSDTRLCELATPGITSIHYDLPQLGQWAAGMLIDHIVRNIPLHPDMSKNDFRGKLIVRESCKQITREK